MSALRSDVANRFEVVDVNTALLFSRWNPCHLLHTCLLHFPLRHPFEQLLVCSMQLGDSANSMRACRCFVLVSPLLTTCPRPPVPRARPVRNATRLRRMPFWFRQIEEMIAISEYPVSGILAMVRPDTRVLGRDRGGKARAWCCVAAPSETAVVALVVRLVVVEVDLSSSNRLFLRRRSS